MNRIRNIAVTLAALGAMALGASAVAGAATGNTTSAAPKGPPSGAPAFAAGKLPPAGAKAPVGKTVTGEDAEKAKAAALASVGSGTAGEVTTGCMGKGYDVTVTKTDGTKVVVHLDSSFKVLTAPSGAPSGPPTGSGAHQGAFIPPAQGAVPQGA